MSRRGGATQPGRAYFVSRSAPTGRKTGDDRFPTNVKNNSFEVALSHLTLRIARYAAPMSSELGGLRMYLSSSFPSAEPENWAIREAKVAVFAQASFGPG
jgi:hypothetical protein